MTEEKYTEQSDLLATGEAFEIDDTQVPKAAYTPTLPGKYVSRVRTLKPANGNPGFVKLQTNGEFGFNFVLVGGVSVPGSRSVSDTKYPFTKYINTGLRIVMDFSKRPPEPFLTNEIDPETGEKKPLRASEVNRYLRAVEKDPKGLRLTNSPEGFQGSLLDAIQESLQKEVGVQIDWHEQVTKNEDGSYPEPVLRTSDFKIGTAADGRPIYATEVKGFIEDRVSQKGRPYKAFVANPEGHTFKARAFVSYFCEVPKK